MFARGFSLAPSPFEAGFLSAAHTEEHVDAFAAACRESLAEAYGEKRA
jgi:glutamate-1-semialdehyde aminotransferase